jgi:hypothetical protein
MKSIITLTHDDPLATARAASGLQQAMDTVKWTDPNSLLIQDLLQQISDQLTAQARDAVLAPRHDPLAITARQLSSFLVSLRGNVIVNGKSNITIELKGEDVHITSH